MDILRVLSTPDSEVRKKTLSLVLDLVSSRNIEDIVLVLKKVDKLSPKIVIFHLVLLKGILIIRRFSEKSSK